MSNYKKWAFLVGVSKYDDAFFINLYHAADHVREFKKILEDSDEFEQIVVLSEEGDEDHKPTSRNIMTKYSKLLRKIKPNDLLIVYILSYGGIFDEQKCIFPKDASKKSKKILKKVSIPLSYFLEEQISNYKPETWKVFFFFDICQCHTVFKSLGGEEKDSRIDELNEDLGIRLMEINEGPSNTSTFYACSGSEKVWAFKKEGEELSVFSYALIKGLSGGIKPPVTYGKIVKYVKEEIINLQNNYDNFPSQTPVSLSSEQGNNTVLIGDLAPFSEEKVKNSRENASKSTERSINLESREKKIESIENRIESHRETLKKFDDLLTSGNMSEVMFQMRIKMINKEIEKLEKELEEIKNEKGGQ